MTQDRQKKIERLLDERPDLVVARPGGSVRFRLSGGRDEQELVYQTVRPTRARDTDHTAHPAVNQYLSLPETVSRSLASFSQTVRHRQIRRQDTERLVIAPGQVRDWPYFFARVFPEYRNLKHLDLSGNEIGSAGARALAAVLPRRLESLVLARNNLRDEGAAAIAAELPAMPGLVVLDLGENRIRDAAAIAIGLGGGTLRSLRLAFNYIRGAEAIAGALHRLPGLTSLDLSCNDFEVEGMMVIAGALHRLPRLATLDLSVDSIGIAGARAIAAAFRDLPALTALNLSHGDIATEGAMAVAAELHRLGRLVTLSLAQNDIGAEGAAAVVAALPPSVTSLDLAGNEIGDAPIVFPHRLRSLDLSANGLTDEGIRGLVPSLRGLRSLTFYHNTFGATGAAALATVFSSRLVHLDLAGSHMGVAGARAIAGPLTGLGLEFLDLSRCDLGAEGVVVLSAPISSLTALTSLELSTNGIYSVGAVALARALRGCSRLVRLDLSYNRIGLSPPAALGARLSRALRLDQRGRVFGALNRDTSGVRAIAGAIRAPLASLDLAGNFLYDEGTGRVAAALAGLSSLTRIDLKHNRIGTGGVRRLARALGNRPVTVNLSGNDLEDVQELFAPKIRLLCRF